MFIIMIMRRVMDFSCLELEDVVKNVLEDNQSKKESSEVISTDVVEALLKEDLESANESTNGDPNHKIISHIPPLTGKNRYPLSPLYKEIAHKLFSWMESSRHPSENLQRFELLEESSIELSSKKDTLIKVEGLLAQLKNYWKNWNSDERKFHVGKILVGLDKRSLLDLLGVRHTVGSVDLFPPSSRKLLNSFCRNHKTNCNLSVGARALSKHCHRDSTSMFWGVCTGSEDAKNNHACTILHKMLNDAVWINLHLLPHDVKVVEVRCSQGYGARWLHDGSDFRGFLEPQMADGHSVKWRH